MPYEKQLAAVIKKLESCRDELGGMGLLGKLDLRQSDWLSEQSLTLSGMILELEEFKDTGNIPDQLEDVYDDEDYNDE